MVGVFKERNTFQVIILVILAAVAKLVYLLHPPTQTYLPQRGVLSNWLSVWYVTAEPFLLAFLAFIINLASAFYANAVLSDQRMFPKTNMLTAMGMVMLSSFFPIANITSTGLCLLPLLIWLYSEVSGLYRAKSPKAAVFNVGLAVGLGAILYHPFILLAAFAAYGLASMRPFSFKEWLILLLGFLTPYYFLFAYDFLNGHWHPLSHLPRLYYSFHQFGKDIYTFITYGIVAVWLLFGFYEWNKALRRMLVQARKSWNLLLLLVFITIGMLFCHTGKSADAYALLVFPVASFGAFAFAGPKKTFIPLLLFWLIAFALVLVCLHFSEFK
jgi:hypothetical protein